MLKKYNHKITKLSDIFKNEISRSILIMNMSFNFELKPYHYKIYLMNEIPSHKYKNIGKKKEYKYSKKKNDPRFKKIDINKEKNELEKKANKIYIKLVVKGCINSESNLNHYFDVLIKYGLLERNDGYSITYKGYNDFMRWILKIIVDNSPDKYIRVLAEVFQTYLKYLAIENIKFDGI